MRKFSRKKSPNRKLRNACRIKNVSITKTVCRQEYKPIKKLEKECGLSVGKRRSKAKKRSPRVNKRRSQRKVDTWTVERIMAGMTPIVESRRSKRKSPRARTPRTPRINIIERRSRTPRTPKVIIVNKQKTPSPKKTPTPQIIYVVPTRQDGLFKPSEDVAFETMRKYFEDTPSTVKVRPSGRSSSLYDKEGKKLGYPVLSRYPLYTKGRKRTLAYDPIANMVLAEPPSKTLYTLTQTPKGPRLTPYRADDPDYKKQLKAMVEEQKRLDKEMEREARKANKELERMRREMEKKRQKQAQLEKQNRLKEAKKIEREIREEAAEIDRLSRRKAKELRRKARVEWKARKRELRAEEKAQKYRQKADLRQIAKTHKTYSPTDSEQSLYRQAEDARSARSGSGITAIERKRRPGTWQKVAKRLGLSSDTISTVMRDKPVNIKLRPRRGMVGMFSREAAEATKRDVQAVNNMLVGGPKRLPLPFPPPSRSSVPPSVQSTVRDYQSIVHVGKEVEQELRDKIANLSEIAHELMMDNRLLQTKLDSALQEFMKAKEAYQANPTSANRRAAERAEKDCQKCYNRMRSSPKQQQFTEGAKSTTDDLYKWAMFREFVDYLRQNNNERSQDKSYKIPTNVGTTTDPNALREAPKAEVTLRDLEHLKELVHRDIEEIRRTLAEQQSLRDQERQLKRELQQERRRTPQLTVTTNRDPTDVEIKYAEVIEQMKDLIKSSNEQIKALGENLKQAGEMQTTVQLADSAEMLDLMRQGNVQGGQLLELMKGIDTYNRAKKDVPNISQVVQAPDMTALVGALERLQIQQPNVQNIDIEKLVRTLKEPTPPNDEMLALINALHSQKAGAVTGEDVAKIIAAAQTKQGSTMSSDDIASLIKSVKQQTPVVKSIPSFSRSDINEILSAIQASKPIDRTDEILRALKVIQNNPANPQIVQVPAQASADAASIISALQRNNPEGTITRSDVQQIINAIQNSAPKDRTGEILEALRGLKNNKPQVIQVPTAGNQPPQIIQVPSGSTAQPQIIQVPSGPSGGYAPTAQPHTYPMMPNYPMMPSPAHFMGGGFYPPPPPYQPYTPNNDSSNMLLTILLMSMMGKGGGLQFKMDGLGGSDDDNSEMMMMFSDVIDKLIDQKTKTSGTSGTSGDKIKAGISAFNPKNILGYNRTCADAANYINDALNLVTDPVKNLELKRITRAIKNNKQNSGKCEELIAEAKDIVSGITTSNSSNSTPSGSKVGSADKLKIMAALNKIYELLVTDKEKRTKWKKSDNPLALAGEITRILNDKSWTKSIEEIADLLDVSGNTVGELLNNIKVAVTKLKSTPTSTDDSKLINEIAELIGVNKDVKSITVWINKMKKEWEELTKLIQGNEWLIDNVGTFTATDDIKLDDLKDYIEKMIVKLQELNKRPKNCPDNSVELKTLKQQLEKCQKEFKQYKINHPDTKPLPRKWTEIETTINNDARFNQNPATKLKELLTYLVDNVNNDIPDVAKNVDNWWTEEDAGANLGLIMKILVELIAIYKKVCNPDGLEGACQKISVRIGNISKKLKSLGKKPEDDWCNDNDLKALLGDWCTPPITVKTDISTLEDTIQKQLAYEEKRKQLGKALNNIKMDSELGLDAQNFNKKREELIKLLGGLAKATNKDQGGDWYNAIGLKLDEILNKYSWTGDIPGEIIDKTLDNLEDIETLLKDVKRLKTSFGRRVKPRRRRSKFGRKSGKVPRRNRKRSLKKR